MFKVRYVYLIIQVVVSLMRYRDQITTFKIVLPEKLYNKALVFVDESVVSKLYPILPKRVNLLILIVSCFSVLFDELLETLSFN